MATDTGCASDEPFYVLHDAQAGELTRGEGPEQAAGFGTDPTKDNGVDRRDSRLSSLEFDLSSGVDIPKGVQR